ncbi:MAG: 50S ribosomal protein L17 [Coriobacteriales bacterium]|jgi:large subunit ribosomal protein L17|nr:50S ribosomal protein L17 [Coriobacteriales bacterium]
MRHYKKGRKLGTDASHTKAMKKNLVVNLFTNDRIKTTLERAKEIRGDVDRVVTWAKRGDVHSRRLAIAKLGDKDLVGEIFSKVAQGMFEGRPGGYTRILRLGTRRGDSATIVIMELVQEPVAKKAAADSGEAKAAGSGAKPAAKGAKPAAKGRKAAAKGAKDGEKDEQPAEPAADEATEGEAPAADEPAGDEAPAIGESADEAPAADESADEPVAAEPTDAAEPAAAEPADVEAPAVDEPAVDEPAVDEQPVAAVAEAPVAAADEPASN